MTPFRITDVPSKAAVGLFGIIIGIASPSAFAQIPTAPVAPRELPAPIDAPPREPVQTPGEGPDIAGLRAMEPELFTSARSIVDPGERALALARIARTSVFSGQSNIAHTAVIEGGEAAKLVSDPLVRDQRIESIIAAALQLAEERVRAPLLSRDPTLPPEPADEKLTPARREQFRIAADEWRYAAALARSIGSPVTRTEASFRVVEGASYATLAMIGGPERLSGDSPARIPAIGPETHQYVGGVLRGAAEEAARIERPVWRDRALVSVAQNSARSDHFALAIEVARMIPQPEIRTDALLRVAESQALSNRRAEATKAYEETARTIAMIPLDDPREVLAGVLIDSLISLGRFDDARAATVLYGGQERRTIALSAVAQSEGKRGLASAARKWIAEEPAEIRSVLYRHLNDGVLSALERDQGRVFPQP